MTADNRLIIKRYGDDILKTVDLSEDVADDIKVGLSFTETEFMFMYNDLPYVHDFTSDKSYEKKDAEILYKAIIEVKDIPHCTK